MITCLRTPKGDWVTAGQLAKAWRAVAAMEPRQSVKGWNWYPTDARDVRRDMLRGLLDRINRHDRTSYHLHLNERRLFTKVRSAAVRGAIVYECKWCGSPLDPLTVNPNNSNSRFCNADCRDSWRG